MSPSSADVVVIGGGVAGVSAALEAAGAGARVVLVRAGPGATALASGAWHGPLPELLRSALEAAGLPYLSTGGALPHPDGELRTAGYAAESHARARLHETATVCGIAGLPGFPAAALARMWGLTRHVTLTLPATPAAGWSPVSLAAQLDRSADLLIDALSAVKSDGTLILPAILGLEHHAELLARLDETLPVPVAEALGTTPSIPGWRLDQALLRALAAASVEVRHARVVARSAREGRLESVTLQGDVASTLTAERFVLATGRFVGGGITAAAVLDAVDVAQGRALREAGLVERALGCDVWIEHLGERFTQVQPVPLTSAVRLDAQPLLGAGVHTDAEDRPVDEAGRVLYGNVVARGAVIAGAAHGLGFAAAPAAPRGDA